MSGPRRKNIEGQTFGYLTAIKPVYGHRPEEDRYRAWWLFKCQCGKEKIMLSGNVVCGHEKSCGCSPRGPKVDPLSVEKRLHKAYRHGAKRRGLSFEIEFEDFLRLIHQPCHYCGDEHSNLSAPIKRMGRLKGQKYKPLAYNGLDRVDNSRGYEPSNVVPCCR